MKQNNSQLVFRALLKWRSFRLKIFVEGVVVGLLAGVVVLMFRYSLEQAELWRARIYQAISHHFWPSVSWFVVLMLVGCVLSRLRDMEPLASGSGIPQVKGELLGYFRMNWLRIILVKFIGGLLAIGSGLSLGREGPSIQLGAAVGKGISRKLGRIRTEERYLITAGASAGLAAAFNAPLAGVIFALEELHKNFSGTVLAAAMGASLAADFVTQQFFGQKPVFSFSALQVLPLRFYLYLVILGIINGVFGVGFNRVLVATQGLIASRLPHRLIPAIPLVLGGFLAWFYPRFWVVDIP